MISVFGGSLFFQALLGRGGRARMAKMLCLVACTSAFVRDAAPHARQMRLSAEDGGKPMKLYEQAAGKRASAKGRLQRKTPNDIYTHAGDSCFCVCVSQQP